MARETQVLLFALCAFVILVCSSLSIEDENKTLIDPLASFLLRVRRQTLYHRCRRNGVVFWTLRSLCDVILTSRSLVSLDCNEIPNAEDVKNDNGGDNRCPNNGRALETTNPCAFRTASCRGTYDGRTRVGQCFNGRCCLVDNQGTIFQSLFLAFNFGEFQLSMDVRRASSNETTTSAETTINAIIIYSIAIERSLANA